jgi:hypothetical protein
MHAAGGNDGRSVMPRGPESAWRHTNARAKRTREGFVRVESGIERDRGNAVRGIAQLLGSALEPQTSRQLGGRLADHAAEHPMEMKGRHPGVSRQAAQIEWLVKMRRDMLNRALDDLGVIASCLTSH